MEYRIVIRDLINKRVTPLTVYFESKESMNRDFGDYTQTYLVGSFDESVLIAYQKSRTRSYYHPYCHSPVKSYGEITTLSTCL